MSPNKQTVEKYMQGFRESNHEKILSCLTDDIVWEMPGAYKHIGKVAFDGEIENENFIGRPTIQITRYIEEDNIVIAEGAVQGKFKDGGLLDAVFCDAFHFRDGKIFHLTTYLMMK